MQQHGITAQCTDEVVDEAEKAKHAELGKRSDLGDMPLITSDTGDAREHDDACYVEADTDPKNKDGFISWVAIADVANYVTNGSALDREARKLGNTTYYPDRDVPRLDDRLSVDACQLHEGDERA